MFEIDVKRLAGQQGNRQKDNHGLKLLFIAAAEELLRQ
jgi:hypothetical protein